MSRVKSNIYELFSSNSTFLHTQPYETKIVKYEMNFCEKDLSQISDCNTVVSKMKLCATCFAKDKVSVEFMEDLFT